MWRRRKKNKKKIFFLRFVYLFCRKLSLIYVSINVYNKHMSLPRASSDPTMGVCPFSEKVIVVGKYQATWYDGSDKFGYKTCLEHWIQRQDKSAIANQEFYGDISFIGLTREQFNMERFLFENMSQGQKNRHLQGFAMLM
jgi:hypothetical protein